MNNAKLVAASGNEIEGDPRNQPMVIITQAFTRLMSKDWGRPITYYKGTEVSVDFLLTTTELRNSLNEGREEGTMYR